MGPCFAPLAVDPEMGNHLGVTHSGECEAWIVIVTAQQRQQGEEHQMVLQHLAVQQRSVLEHLVAAQAQMSQEALGALDTDSKTSLDGGGIQGWRGPGETRYSHPQDDERSGS